MSTTNLRGPRPTADPEVTLRLRAHIADAVFRAPRTPKSPGEMIGGSAAHSDTGRVPPQYFRAMAQLARDAGYTVRLKNLGGTYRSGYQTGPLASDDSPPFTLTLHDGMSPASLARVFVHEMTHGLLAHGGRTESEARQIFSDRRFRAMFTGIEEDTGKEVACELAAYAVTREAGIGTGKFSLEYLMQRLPYLSREQLREAAYAAELAARVIWSAVGPVVS